MFVVQLLLVLSLISVFFSGETAGAVCGQTYPAILVLPGKPVKNGAPGSDGSPGPPGTVPDAVIEQVKGDIYSGGSEGTACLHS